MVYLFAYSNGFGLREDISHFLSSCSLVQNWRFDMPNCYYIASDNSAQEIAKAIQDEFPNKRFLVTQMLADKYQGWLPRSTWNFIRENL
jgi:hypothetical protein